jgi:hypothetical protein
LLVHELAHVVQQTRGGARPVGGCEAAHEREADAVADSVLRGTRPAPIRAGTGVGIACAPLPFKLASVDDPPDLTWFDELPGGDAPAWTSQHLADTIDELEHWKRKQIQTTPTMLRVNQALAWLATELERKPKAKPAPLTRGAAAARPEQPETLHAQKTIVYKSAAALREEIGRIRTYLPYASVDERRILAIELPGLLAQFQNSRAAAEDDRRMNEVAQALSRSASGAPAELIEVAQRVDTIRPVPGEPGIKGLYWAHSVFRLTDQEAAALRANVLLALDQVAARVRSVNHETYRDGRDFIDHNEANRHVARVVTWYGQDPIAAEEAALDYVMNSNRHLNFYQADRGKDVPLRVLAQLVLSAADLAQTGVVASESAQGHAFATAGKWLTTLQVSKTVLTTMVATKGAEFVGPRATGFFQGVGLSGAAAPIAGGATTIAVVATADGLLHAVPATLGARLFGSRDAVFTDEFWAGAKEGAFAATSVQATLGFDRLLGVTAGDVSRLGKIRSITAGGLANATAGLAQSLIERRGLRDTALSAGLDFTVGGAGRSLGFLTKGATPRVRGFVNTLFGATASGWITAIRSGNPIEIAGAAALGGTLMGKERTANEHAAAMARGRRAGGWVRSRAIDVIAAASLGTAALPPFRGSGSGGDPIVLTDTVPRPGLLSGGPALRAPTLDLFATQGQPAVSTEKQMVVSADKAVEPISQGEVSELSSEMSTEPYDIRGPALQPPKEDINVFAETLRTQHAPFSDPNMWDKLRTPLMAIRRASGIRRETKSAVTPDVARSLGGNMAVSLTNIEGVRNGGLVVGRSPEADGEAALGSPFSPRTDPVKLPHTHRHAEQELAERFYAAYGGLNPAAWQGRTVWILVEAAPCAQCMNDVLPALSAAFPGLTIEVKSLESSRILRYRDGVLLNR